MKHLWLHFTGHFKKRRLFFTENFKAIAEDNLRTLFWAVWALVILLVFFLGITPVIIDSWTITVYHIAFLPVTFLLLGIIAFVYTRKTHKAGIIYALCFIFQAIIYCFVILLDTAGAKDVPASFTPVIYIAMPAIFTLPFYVSYGLLGFFEILYFLAILTFKSPEVGQYDIFNSLVGIGCSFAIHYLIMSLRLRDYETQMKYKTMSMKDSLSSIYNKQASEAAARQYLTACNPSVVCSFLVLDLDDFKKVNDTKGHIAGDRILGCVGKILLNLFRHTDIVGRFGGDEFLILVKGTASPVLIEKKCQAIQEALQQISRMEIDMQVSCSLGVVLVQKQPVDYDTLFLTADRALYEAKRAGKAQYCIQNYKN